MNRARRQHRRHDQRGFALLIVFLMAAAIAFSLYVQLPRVAFESVRDKEQLLIDRGGQYKRAIEVYFAVNKRYPATLDDLEKGDKRYLRRRYKDPLNGKDEWRIIHTNGTMLTDSLVQKPGTQAAGGGNGMPGGGPLGANNMNSQGQESDSVFAPPNPASPPGNMSAATAALASAGFSNTPLPFGNPANGNNNNPNQNPNQPSQLNAAALRRPSDRIEMNLSGEQNSDDNNDSSQNVFDPNNLPAITLPPQNLQQGQPEQNPGQPGIGQPQLQPGLSPNANAAQGPIGLGEPQPGQAELPFPGQTGGQPPNPQFPPPPFGQTGTPQGFPPGQNPAQANALGQFTGQGGSNPQPVFIPPAPGFNPSPPSQGRQSPGSQNLVPPANQNSQPSFAPSGRGGNTPVAPLGSPNAAQVAVDRQLRTPGNSAPFNQNGIQPGANNLGSPGIAGVASKFEGPSIKTYGKREKYQEWEFVFDPAAARITQQPLQPGQNGQNPLQPNQSTPAGGFGSPNIFSQPPAANQPQTNPGLR